MNDIKIAMTVNGEIIESGDILRVTDQDGDVTIATFIRAHVDGNRPGRMTLRLQNDGKGKFAMDGTTAQRIEKVG